MRELECGLALDWASVGAGAVLEEAALDWDGCAVAWLVPMSMRLSLSAGGSSSAEVGRKGCVGESSMRGSASA